MKMTDSEMRTHQGHHNSPTTKRKIIDESHFSFRVHNYKNEEARHCMLPSTMLRYTWKSGLKCRRILVWESAAGCIQSRAPGNSQQSVTQTHPIERHLSSTTSLRSSLDQLREPTIINNGSAISVPFSGDESSIFHAPWLWVNDPSYVHPTSGQKLRTPGRFPHRKIVAVEATWSEGNTNLPSAPPPPPGCLHPHGGVYRTKLSKDNNNQNSYMIRVTWDDSEVSFYHFDWLTRCRYDDDILNHQNDIVKVTKEVALGALHNSSCPKMPTFEYNHVINDDDALFSALHGINEHGAVLIENAPAEPNESIVASLGKHLSSGSLSHGALYGDVFHVKSTQNPNNIAYTNVPLPPHQDLAYYESKPYLQLLHCARNARVVGGESVLIDAMAAADEFQSLAPDLFEILTKYDATFLKQREGADMVSRKPHIQCATSTKTGNKKEITAVNWSPPFEGPLAIPPKHVKDYFVAYSALERMLDNSLPTSIPHVLPVELERTLRDYSNNYTWEWQLQPGQILVFSNQRMLHGRRGFQLQHRPEDENPADIGRHLIGCYTQVDETLSRYRLLLRDRPYRDKHLVRSAGNGVRGSI